MSEDEIRGRNLIVRGDFSDGWDDVWERVGEQGHVGRYEETGIGYYVMMNQSSVIKQTFDTARLSSAQLTQAQYRLSFKYENSGDGTNSKVIIRTASGVVDPIDLSGKPPEQPQAAWNNFEPYPFDVVEDDRSIDIEPHGSALGGGAGLRLKGFDVQLHLPPLVLKSVTLDERSYEP